MKAWTTALALVLIVSGCKPGELFHKAAEKVMLSRIEASAQDFVDHYVEHWARGDLETLYDITKFEDEMTLDEFQSKDEWWRLRQALVMLGVETVKITHTYASFCQFWQGKSVGETVESVYFGVTADVPHYQKICERIYGDESCGPLVEKSTSQIRDYLLRFYPERKFPKNEFIRMGTVERIRGTGKWMMPVDRGLI